MNTYTLEMEVKEDKKKNGWVAEIRGFDSTYKFRNHFMKPKRYRRNIGNFFAVDKFDLIQGKAYMIKKGNESNHHFVKIVNGQMVQISEHDVEDLLKKSGNKPQTKDTRLEASNQKKTDPQQPKELEFIIINLEHAFDMLRVRGKKNLFDALLKPVKEYAKCYGLVDECHAIYQAFSERKSSHHIRMNL